MQARDIMSSPVVSVTPDMTVKYAANLLSAHGFSALPVLDEGGRLIGVVTEADLVRDRFPRDARYRDGDGPDEPPALPPPGTVGGVMTTPAVGTGAGTDVVDLVRVLLEDRIRSMPIVDGAHVVGIVTRRDLVQALARDDEVISADVRHQLAIYGGPTRWTVEVHDGAVEVVDAFDDETDRHVATVLAQAVPGVTAVRVTSTSTTG
ncbi:CBS domain-containing protein [Amycolatopsis sp. DG1A-15b]|uniref:CBS domain-containing protein n=1 Tax=Amycolatopsis sp. DG1A-15b TaxID=3052846 RepID=UPI00255B8416|nr:CBS domain-containing protein [Amycolatopsis sp. DG1A-15b]WIX92338.1 CBS domain-containing protein [Amycolatopsis sp. DG1A-15b]